MNIFLLLSFLVTTHGLPKPQVLSMETIQDVFGSPTEGRYGGVTDNSQQVQDTIKDIVGGYDGEEFIDNAPNDYVEPSNENLVETVTVEILADNEDCASYTETLGYMCVPYYQCSNGTIITDGAGLIDIRNGFGALNAQDGKCPGFLDVCCKDPEFVPPPPQPQPYKESCGRRNTNGLGVRIQGFNEGESQVGEWPHMCALLREEVIAEEAAEGYEGGEIKSTTVNHFVCGASLIEPGVVLTGAHCVNGFKNNEILKVRCGEWDTQSESEAYPHQDRYVNNFIVHPLFNSQNLFNDYAVLFTTADFTMDHNVDTICLPQPGETFISEDCFATGWGKDKFGKGGEYQVILKEIDLPVVDNNQCQSSLRQTRLGGKFQLDDSFLCAGGIPGKDTCKGDGGSPLVCPSKTIPNRYVQAGIVAWGIGCGEQGTPGVYGDVSKGVCFIDHVMSCNGVEQGGRADTSLGFTSQQCGSWFQDSLPANLPDRAKDGAAHQYLSTQCNVNYLETSNIGGEFVRDTVTEESYAGPQPHNNSDNYNDDETNEVQTINDGYNDVQTNEDQSNSQGYNDDQTKNVETSDNSYNDTNSDVYNENETNQVQCNEVKTINDVQTNEDQSNSDGYNDEQTKNVDTSDNSCNDTNSESYNDDETNQVQTINDGETNQVLTINDDETNQDQTFNDGYNEVQTNSDIYNDVQTNDVQTNSDGYNDVQTTEVQPTTDLYNHDQTKNTETSNNSYNGQDSKDNSQQAQDTIKDIIGEEFVDNVPNDYVKPSNENNDVQTNEVQTNSNGYNDVQTTEVQPTTDGYNDDQTKNTETSDNSYNGQDLKDNSEEAQDIIEDIIGEEFVDNVPNDYVEPSNENLAETVTVEVLADNEDCASYTETLGYTCVPYYQCSNGTIITDGAGLIDIRNGFGALNAQDGKCPGFLDVCCKDPEFVPPPPQPQPYQASCGRRNTNGLGVRIQGFNEEESQVGEWPHMCALLREEVIAEEAAEGYEGGEIKSTTVNHFICGASMIKPGVVLTGAHCVNGFKNNEILKVRCGEWDTQTESEAYPHQDRYVNNFIVHPLFNSQNLFNDYAVLFTTADFTMEHNVDTICLPQPGETFVSEDCFATGWGKDKFGKEGEYQVILKEIDLPVVDNNQCQSSLRQTRLGEKFQLDDSFLCAGGTPEKDTCKGDGGSPLVCPSKTIPNRFVQAGIVAWGIGCGEQGTPGVYGDVAKGVCFIDHVMSCNGVEQGGRADTSLGFTSQQCGSWFQDSLPANLPDRAKDGAAHQYLSTQCTVNYLESSFIGDEFARDNVTEESYAGPQPQTNSDGYNDDQTSDNSYNGQDNSEDQVQESNNNPYRK